MSEWIPIAERKPEFRTSVLVGWTTFPGVEPEVAWFSGKGIFGRFALDKQPTHWQPLPAPPCVTRSEE